MFQVQEGWEPLCKVRLLAVRKPAPRLTSFPPFAVPQRPRPQSAFPSRKRYQRRCCLHPRQGQGCTFFFPFSSSLAPRLTFWISARRDVDAGPGCSRVWQLLQRRTTGFDRSGEEPCNSADVVYSLAPRQFGLLSARPPEGPPRSITSDCRNRPVRSESLQDREPAAKKCGLPHSIPTKSAPSRRGTPSGLRATRCGGSEGDLSKSSRSASC